MVDNKLYKIIVVLRKTISQSEWVLGREILCEFNPVVLQIEFNYRQGFSERKAREL